MKKPTSSRYDSTDFPPAQASSTYRAQSHSANNAFESQSVPFLPSFRTAHVQRTHTYLTLSLSVRMWKANGGPKCLLLLMEADKKLPAKEGITFRKERKNKLSSFTGRPTSQRGPTDRPMESLLLKCAIWEFACLASLCFCLRPQPFPFGIGDTKESKMKALHSLHT